jgi:hypothetical protein
VVTTLILFGSAGILFGGQEEEMWSSEQSFGKRVVHARGDFGR